MQTRGLLSAVHGFLVKSMSKEWVPLERQAAVWKHFLRNKNDSREVRCKLCPRQLKNPSTNSARYHLENLHCIKEDKKTTNATEKQPTTIAAAFSAASKDNLDLVLARLVAVDRLSFFTISNSVDIQEGMRARGFKVLKSASAVRIHVSTYADQIREQTTLSFKSKLNKQEKFALTIDEYTSLNNRR